MPPVDLLFKWEVIINQIVKVPKLTINLSIDTSNGRIRTKYFVRCFFHYTTYVSVEFFQQIIDWFVQILIAVKYIHSLKILHRGKKPKMIYFYRSLSFNNKNTLEVEFMSESSTFSLSVSELIHYTLFFIRTSKFFLRLGCSYFFGTLSLKSFLSCSYF